MTFSNSFQVLLNLLNLLNLFPYMGEGKSANYQS